MEKGERRPWRTPLPIGYAYSLERGAKLRDAPPACQHAAIISAGGLRRRRKMRLLGIPTSHQLSIIHKPKSAKICQREKKLSVVIPKLQTQLNAAPPKSLKGRTSSASCWNYAAKSRNRKPLLPFSPKLTRGDKLRALRA